MCIRSIEAAAFRRASAAAMFFALLSIGPACAQGYPSKFDFGQPATEQEIAAFAIAIPADGKGLPPGKGDYAKGKQVYETACAACPKHDIRFRQRYQSLTGTRYDLNS